jgi:tetratricopeptide (TPR) repeat protein
MRRFGTSSSRMKHLTVLRRHFLRSVLISCTVGVIAAGPEVAMSQSGTSSALAADINYRRRELENNPKSAEARAQLAIALERTKDYEGMVATLEGHKDKLGKSGLVLLARAQGKLGHLNDDVATLELANARYPKNAQLQTLLGSAQARAGHKDAAIETLYKAKATNPKYIPAYDALLAELVDGESRQEARDLISDMVKKFRMKPRWASELCHLYSLDAFHQKTVETCLQALRIDSGNPMNAVYLATSYREQGEPEKAKNILIKTAKRIRRSEPVQTALGDYYSEKKNFVDAYRWYKAGVKQDPKSFQAQLGLAQAALELQKMEDSVVAFTAACKIKRSAIREFQSGLIKIRNRGDAKWQGRFEDAIANSCQISF